MRQLSMTQRWCSAGWLLGALLLTGCASTPDSPEPLGPLYFPPPPELPRFVFERTLRGSGDIEIEDRETRMRRMLTGETGSGSGFAKPFDVSVCQGKIYVSDTVRRVVLAFDVPNGRFFEIGAEEPGLLTKPLGLATDEDCDLYVADGTASRITIYDQNGRFIKAVGGSQWFERLSHLTVNPEGSRIYAIDTGGVSSNSHRIRVFDVSSGEHLRDIGTRGEAAGQFNLPRDIDLGRDGLLYVVDGGNFRVQVLRKDGTLVSSFGSVGRRTGQFSRPKGIGVDAEGNSYVSDASHGNFQIFNPQGQLLLFVGDRSEKAERAKFMLPAGLDVDEDGRVYMVDQFFRKVDIFRPASLDENQGYLGVWASR